MKHRQVGVPHVRLINKDGHAIGLDIGATAVRAAILKPGTVGGRPSVTLHGLGEMPLPPGAVVNGVVAEPTHITNALKKLWAEYKFECRNVIIGVTNQQVVVREVNLPNIPEDKRAQALPFQARDIVALPIEQAVLDFIPVGGVDESTDTIPGLLIAAPREPVLVAVNAVEAAGLTVARVDLASFALLRSVAGADLGVEGVVDLGAHLTNVVVHNHGVPQVVRTVTRGGQTLTDHLVSRLGLDPYEAEEAKRANGLVGPDASVVMSLGDAVRPLLAEIRSSLHLFSNTHPDAPIQRVSLTGAAARLPGLADTLAEQLGIPVEVITPLQHIANRYAQSDKRGSNEAHATAVSVGLAMGAAA
jgi:type IV pilus assembly protein PilM